MADPDAQALVSFVAARDAPCPVCAYNLRGIRTPVCPECAAPLRLDVTSVNLHLGPWSLVIIALALGLGFDGVVSLMLGSALGFAMVFRGAPRGQLYPPLTILSTIAILGLLSFLTLVAFTRRRGAWRRLPLRRQWRLAVLIFIVVGVVHALGGAGLVLWLSRR